MNSFYSTCIINRCLLTKLQCYILFHSAKTGTTGIFSWKTCNISGLQHSKRHSKAKSSFVTLVYVSCRTYFLFTSSEGTFSLHIFFSRTPCICPIPDITKHQAATMSRAELRKCLFLSPVTRLCIFY